MFTCLQTLPAQLVLLPVALWSFSSHDTLPATVFTIWCVLVAASDNVLKPVLMGRGQNVPMLVLLIGSLGGMLLSPVRSHLLDANLQMVSGVIAAAIICGAWIVALQP